MSKIASAIRREFRHLLPSIIFFLVVFHIVHITNNLILHSHGVTPTHSTLATIGALIVAKAVLVADKLRMTNLFPNRPLIYTVLWKTFIYSLIALAFRFLEELIPIIHRTGSLAIGADRVIAEIHWPSFWSMQIWLVFSLLLYCASVELIRALGPDRVVALFFGQRTDGQLSRVPAS